MKNQALFSLKDKSKELKCLLLQFLFDALRVKINRSPGLRENNIVVYRGIWDFTLSRVFTHPVGRKRQSFRIT